MSYQVGEARILTLIQAISPSTWTGANSLSLANDANNVGMAVMNSGKSHHYALLEPGPFQVLTEDVGFNSYIVRWQTVIKLYVAKTSNKPPMKVLAEDREAIIAQLMKYQRLNNLTGVVHAQVGSGSKITTERVGPAPLNKQIVLFKQEVTHTWEEKVEVSQQD